MTHALDSPTPVIRGCAVAIAAGVMAALGACQSGYRSFEREVQAAVMAGEYDRAAAIAAAEAEDNAKDRINRVIYNLEAARLTQIAGDIESSRRFFALVQDDVRPYLDQRSEDKVTEALATTAVNQTTAIFTATPVDRIMASTLDAVNAMVLGDLADARVQLNLARDWQDDAVRRYRDTIERSEARIQTAAAQQGVPLSDRQIGGVLETGYAGLADLRAYADYQNPFASHLRAVFLLAAGVGPADTERARFELREVLAMEPRAADVVATDLEQADRAGPHPPTVWVYVMTGRAPRLEERRLDLPIFVGNVNYIAGALPNMAFHDDFVGTATVTASGDTAEAVPLADIDAMVAAEFKDRLPTIVAQEILSSTLKVGLTYSAGESGGSFAQLIGIIYQAASTSADTRTWRSLPKRILVARVPTPPDGQMTARVGPVETAIQVRPGQSHIVIITLPTPWAGRPSVLQASLTPGIGPRSSQETHHDDP
jgi:hypothetical protein